MKELLIAEATRRKVARMYLKRAVIKNFWLLSDVTLDLDESLTLFVGKNNTGKTSLVATAVAAQGGIAGEPPRVLSKVAQVKAAKHRWWQQQ